MKKNLLTVLSIVMAFAMAFTAVGCNSLSQNPNNDSSITSGSSDGGSSDSGSGDNSGDNSGSSDSGSGDNSGDNGGDCPLSIETYAAAGSLREREESRGAGGTGG